MMIQSNRQNLRKVKTDLWINKQKVMVENKEELKRKRKLLNGNNKANHDLL